MNEIKSDKDKNLLCLSLIPDYFHICHFFCVRVLAGAAGARVGGDGNWIVGGSIATTSAEEVRGGTHKVKAVFVGEKWKTAI